MVQGNLRAVPTEKAVQISNKHFIELAQRFLDDMKKEIDHE